MCVCVRARSCMCERTRFVYVYTYKGRKKRRMGKGGKGEETTSPNSLARTHARSIVPAGSHFVLARRPDILPWESIARNSLYPTRFFVQLRLFSLRKRHQLKENTWECMYLVPWCQFLNIPLRLNDRTICTSGQFYIRYRSVVHPVQFWSKVCLRPPLASILLRFLPL